MSEKSPARQPSREVLLAENELNQAYAKTFSDDSVAALKVLRHLQAVTLGHRLPPGAADALLRHMEGQRALMHAILDRIDLGRKNLPAVPPEEPK